MDRLTRIITRLVAGGSSRYEPDKPLVRCKKSIMKQLYKLKNQHNLNGISLTTLERYIKDSCSISDALFHEAISELIEEGKCTQGNNLLIYLQV